MNNKQKQKWPTCCFTLEVLLDRPFVRKNSSNILHGESEDLVGECCKAPFAIDITVCIAMSLILSWRSPRRSRMLFGGPRSFTSWSIYVGDDINGTRVGIHVKAASETCEFAARYATLRCPIISCTSSRGWPGSSCVSSCWRFVKAATFKSTSIFVESGTWVTHFLSKL